MAHSGAGQTLATNGNIHGDVGYLNQDLIRSVGPGTWKNKDQQIGGPPQTIVIIEQWICFVLGFVCIAFGIWGICMKLGHRALLA